MGLFDSIFGGGTKSVPTSSTTKLPDWVEQGGKDLFEGGKLFAGRDYPSYPVGDRIAPFTPDQLAAFEATRGNVGSWYPAFSSAYGAAGASASPVGAEDISRYMNPFTDEVIASTMEEMNRQFGRDTINRHASMANRGSYLNEDRREIMDNTARESNARVMAETIARLKSGAFDAALGQANTERDRTRMAAQMFGELAPMRQQLGSNDAAGLAATGALQQAQDQEGRTLSYDDWMREFSYPQEQINWLLGLLRGTPYETTTEGTTPVATGNPWAQGIGAAAALYGMFA